jgi:vitamin B12 transporter
MVRISILMFLTAIGEQIAAQTDSLRSFETRDIVISASRTEQEPFKIGRSVTLLTRDDLNRRIHRSFGELLARQTGTFIVGAGQVPGGLQSIAMRGVANHQTAVFVDGFRLIDPSSVDNALDLTELDLSGVERIEIVRGAHGTLYGSPAVGGMIHVITSGQRRTGFQGRVVSNNGIFGSGTHDLNQTVNLRYGLWNGLFAEGSMYHQSVRGLNATIDTVRTPGVFKNIDRDDLSRLNVSLGTGLTNDEWDVRLRYSQTNYDADIDDGAFVNDPNYTVDVTRHLSQLSIRKFLSDRLSFTWSGGYSAFKRDAIDDSSVVNAAGDTDHSYYRGTFEGELAQAEAQINWRGRAISVVAGGGLNAETMTSRVFILNTAFNFSSLSDLDTLDIHSTLGHVFVHGDINGAVISDHLLRWNLGLGTRWNRHDRYGTNWTFELNPSYQASEHTILYAAFTGGFNAPSLYRLYAPDSYYTSNITRGNENLKPEKSRTFEAGIKQRFERVEGSVAYYRSRVSEIVDFVYLWDSQIGIDTLGNDFLRDDYRGDTYLNIGTQTVDGMELEFVLRPHDAVRMGANAAFAWGKLEYDESKIDAEKTQGHHVQVLSNGVFLTGKASSKRLIRRPHTVNGDMTIKVMPSTHVGGAVRYVGRRYDVFYNPALGPFGALDSKSLPPYAVVDVHASHQLNDHLSVSVQLNNVFNDTQQEIRGYRSVGRALYAGIRYGW